MLHSNSVFITNGAVAWQIPEENGISFMYENGFYLPPDGWRIVRGLPREWLKIPCGMWVKDGVYAREEDGTKPAAVTA